MKEKLLVDQEEVPDGIDIKDSKLIYRGIDLLDLSEKYGTPLRMTYLPVISERINEMNSYFKEAMIKYGYQGKYSYYYCTKSSHFSHIVKKVLESEIGIEISSAYDIELVKSLVKEGTLLRDSRIICNGYKTPDYLKGIKSLLAMDHCSILPIIDSKSELLYYDRLNIRLDIGVRLNLGFLASYKDESRFGLSPQEIISFYHKRIKGNKDLKITTLHFFYEKGISASNGYCKVLEDVTLFYCNFKRSNPELNTLDIGGGMPFHSSFESDNEIQDLINMIITTIHGVCHRECIPEPDIVTEFGKYTVADATMMIFKIHERKFTDGKNWGIVDGSFITHLPDTWAIKQEYTMVAINNLQYDYRPFLLGGLTCDSADFYPSSGSIDSVMLPDTDQEQYIAFLHTGAYQEVLSGFGGINHCLIPSPKHILIRRDSDENLTYEVFAEKQNIQNTMNILGYR
ncbi:arginine decarboxylase [Chryseobacterium sp. Mn2064]|uniref:arginine decarboxylase n=1 Tax=Chryseobacterium sp. Mn2064 TaxID=3395263 RepID=UPI003BD7D4BE